jgi:hypothetical protein
VLDWRRSRQEKFANEVSKSQDDYQMPSDYAKMLEGYDSIKAVRGKYYKRTQKSVTLLTQNGARATLPANGIDLRKTKPACAGFRVGF